MESIKIVDPKVVSYISGIIFPKFDRLNFDVLRIG